MSQRLEELAERRRMARNAGSPKAVEKHHAKGKMTARERIDYLLDDGSFQELDMLARHRAHGMGLEEQRPYTDGVITGFGTIDGRRVCVFSQDFTVFGGALGEVFAEKIHKVMDLAASIGVPMIGLNDGAGARIQEGVVSLHSYGGIFHRNAQASGVDPPDQRDPRPVRRRRRLQPGHDRLHLHGPGDQPHVHHRPRRGEDGDRRGRDPRGARRGHEPRHQVGGGHLRRPRREGLPRRRPLPARLPPLQQPRGAAARRTAATTPSGRPRSSPSSCRRHPNQPYDMNKVIEAVVDDGEFFEVNHHWAMNLVCGFARIDGRVVGIVGNQPQMLAGVLDIDASEKGARFVRTCDAFNIPLITFVDVPGFMPGTDQEYGGIIRHGAKLLYAYCESTVPRVQIITRKAYGGAYVVMNSKSIGADLAYAWPSAELAVMGPEGAVEIVYRRDLAEADDPVARREELVEEYTERYANPYVGGRAGLRRRRHRPGRHPQGARPEPGPARLQARGPAQAQAREHARCDRRADAPTSREDGGRHAARRGGRRRGPGCGGRPGRRRRRRLAPASAAVSPSGRHPRWRFSGRWWSRPATTRRDRPWT